MAHFLEGVDLTGGIPLVEQVDHLGMLGITAQPLLVEGWLTLVELTGMFPCTGSVVLLVKAGGTRLPNGKAGISGAGWLELKGWWEHGGISPVLFHSLPSASNSNKKVKLGAWSLILSFSVWNCQETSPNMIWVPLLVGQSHQFSIHFHALLS